MSRNACNCKYRRISLTIADIADYLHDHMTEEVQTGRNPIANIADIADIENPIANIADIADNIADIADIENPLQISQISQISQIILQISQILKTPDTQIIDLDLCQ